MKRTDSYWLAFILTFLLALIMTVIVVLEQYDKITTIVILGIVYVSFFTVALLGEE